MLLPESETKTLEELGRLMWMLASQRNPRRDGTVLIRTKNWTIYYDNDKTLTIEDGWKAMVSFELSGRIRTRAFYNYAKCVRALDDLREQMPLEGLASL
ncbi:MAG: hypothetical protein AB7L09_01705 [Nitrospira sp.]